MARHLNRVYLIGNLTRDPELRYTPNNTAVCEFGLAVNRNYQDNSGEWQEDTSYVDINVWARQAENCSQYLEKGSRVFLEGRLDFQSWETDDGQNRSKLEVTAQRVIFLDAAGENVEAGVAGGAGAGAGGDTPEDILEDFEGGETEDDIPF
ncbi:MAG: single-stranded DNA-binding protein [bacterium]